MSRYYRLIGREVHPIEAPDSDPNIRRIGHTDITMLGLWVSTVFLTINHQFDPNGPPVLFETMVFPMENMTDLYCARYSTYDEAEAGHWEAVWKVLDGEIIKESDQ